MARINEIFRDLVTEANLAPSVHNVQPAKWKVNGDQIELFVCTNPAMPSADPHMRDIEIIFGAAADELLIADSL